MPYKPISSYGIIGDLRTAALIALDGSLDWLCLPRFDSPSIFAALLDDRKGGHFRLAMDSANVHHRQLYLADSNVLVTRYLSPNGVAEVTDFMPLSSRGDAPASTLVRRVRAVSGPACFHLECAPAFNYALGSHRVDLVDGGAVFRSPELSLRLDSPAPLKSDGRSVKAKFSLQESETLSFLLQPVRDGQRKPSESEIDQLEEETLDYWRRWLGKCTYVGRWREMVHRSALMLQLLTYAPTGAIIAAPSCSLPERIGGERNWDYRYNWIRDAAYTLYAELRIGLIDEATRFMKWIEERCSELADAGPLQTVYAVDGSRDLHERTLDHLQGYRGSRPVRAGNDAFRQVQLDIYGALVDAVYLYNKYAQPIDSMLWRDVRRLLNWLCDSWQNPDQGIWEFRGEPRQLVHSKVMCWVALDRGLRLADVRAFPAERERWLKARDQIYEQVLEKGWNRQLRSFVQSYGSDTLDAAVLIMPLVFFMSPKDPMMQSTVDAISRPFSQGGLVSDGMVYRYRPSETQDGLSTGEGTFNMCSFWLVEALTRMGRLREARYYFEKMLTRANHLGLYSEETSLCGEPLGNFPQAFTHMGLISAAVNLDRMLSKQK